MTPPCPSDDGLRRLRDDALDAPQFADVERHVESCPNCIARLEAMGRAISTAGPSGPRLPTEGVFPRIPGLTIEGELGRGGTGVVYRALQEDVGRTVAVKVIPGGDVRARRRWRNEVQTAARAGHPDVVQVYAAGEAEGLFYVVMEHVEGGSLGVRAVEAMPPRWAAAFIVDVARTVEHFHAKGLVHLDLTPANILVDESTGRLSPKVVDFGLARTIAPDPRADVTRDGVRGTPSYMAPEQTVGDGSAIGPPADVYALGAVLYRLLAGRPPFRAGSDLDTMKEVCDRPPIPPRRLTRGVPADLETIALKCLEKAPERRYPTAAALADDLARWLEGQPIEARPVSMLRRGWRLARRRPRRVAACMVLGLGLTTGLGVRTELRRWSDRESAEAERVLERLVRLAEQELSEPFPVRAGRLAPTVELIHDQVGRLGPDRHLDGSMILRLSEIDGKTTRHLAIEGRIEEAAALAHERLEILRARGDALSGDAWRRRVIGGAFLDAAAMERLRGDAAPALDLLDHASETAFGSDGSVDLCRGLALLLSEEYALLHEELARGGDAALAAKAAAGLVTAKDVLDTEGDDRFESMLLRAGALADAGRWQDAEGLVRGLLVRRPACAGTPGLGFLTQEATQIWIRTEVRASLTRAETAGVGLAAGSPGLDETLRSLSLLAARAGLPADGLPEVVTDEMAVQIGRLRRADRIDEADRAAAVFRAWAGALVRDYPSSAAARFTLAESHSQESKNARRIDHDLHGRLALETAIRIVREAIDLEPGSERYWSALKRWSARLSVLPES